MGLHNESIQRMLRMILVRARELILGDWQIALLVTILADVSMIYIFTQQG